MLMMTREWVRVVGHKKERRVVASSRRRVVAQAGAPWRVVRVLKGSVCRRDWSGGRCGWGDDTDGAMPLLRKLRGNVG